MAEFLLSIVLRKDGEKMARLPRPKLAFRGRDRKRIRSLLKTLKSIQKMDTERSDSATANGVPAILYRLNGATNVTGALTQLLARCDSSLIQRVSAQALPAQGGEM